jgi:histidinol-phosphate aminotransferase
MSLPKPVPHLAAVAPYPLAVLKPADQSVPLVSLAQNESACAPSPAALAAAIDALQTARLYPDPEWTDLRQAIAEVHDVEPGDIICGAGSMDLIGAIARCFLAPGSRALTTAYGYYFFRTAAHLAGAAIDLAPERDFVVDPQAVLAHVTPETRVVFIANPGNPTGTLLDPGALIALREAMPSNILLVIDEAYSEFGGTGAAGHFHLVRRGDTVVLRTLSKAYGLAGLRVGWGLFPPSIGAEVRKVMLPNNLSAVALAAAAAAMRDQAGMRNSVAFISDLRDRFASRMVSAGIHVPKSNTNFVLLVFPSQAIAGQADTMLRKNGIAMRRVDNYGLGHCLRATIGAEDHMNRSAQILETFMEK